MFNKLNRRGRRQKQKIIALLCYVSLKIMIIKHDFLSLFTKFIKSTETGHRMKQNGHRINSTTVKNYYNTLRLLKDFKMKKKLN